MNAHANRTKVKGTTNARLISFEFCHACLENIIKYHLFIRNTRKYSQHQTYTFLSFRCYVWDMSSGYRSLALSFQSGCSYYLHDFYMHFHVFVIQFENTRAYNFLSLCTIDTYIFVCEKWQTNKINKISRQIERKHAKNQYASRQWRQ